MAILGKQLNAGLMIEVLILLLLFNVGIKIIHQHQIRIIKNEKRIQDNHSEMILSLNQIYDDLSKMSADKISELTLCKKGQFIYVCTKTF